MKKTLVPALTTALVVGAASTTFAAANPFADVPADNNNKALIEKLFAEFSDELANLGVRVANLEAKTDNVKWQGLIRYDWNTTMYESRSDAGDDKDSKKNNVLLRFEPSITINENWTGHARLDYAVEKDDDLDSDRTVSTEWVYAEGNYGKFDVKLGRFNTFSDASHGLVIDIDSATGVELQYAPASNWKVKATAARISNGDFDTHLVNLGDDAATYFADEVNYANGKWEAGVGYHRVGLGTHTLVNTNEDTFQVADAGVAYAFDKNVKASFDYARTTDWKVNDDSHKDSYNVQVSYKGADAADKGSWGAYVAYRKLSPLASFGATYDYRLGTDGLSSLKGWELGADYAFAKNIVASAKYFNGKDTLLNDSDKVTGVWSRVDFLF